MVDKKSQNGSRDNEELHSKGVMVPIICGFEFAVDHPHCGIRTCNIYKLHGGIIEGDIVSKQI